MADTTYTIFSYVPYEGQSAAFEGTLAECKAWVQKPNLGYMLEDLEIYSNDAPDIYSLLAEQGW